MQYNIENLCLLLLADKKYMQFPQTTTTKKNTTQNICIATPQK